MTTERHWNSGALIRFKLARSTKLLSEDFYRHLTHDDVRMMKVLDNDFFDARDIIRDGVIKNYPLQLVDKALAEDCEDLGIMYRKHIKIFYEFASLDNIPKEWETDRILARDLITEV